MVHFTAGKPNRKEYRKFNIKGVEGPDDYASMAEVIERRYRRLHEAGEALPDLLIVDGGEGQMHVAEKALRQVGVKIPIAGLAKDDNHRTSELLVFSEQCSVSSKVAAQKKLNTEHLTLNTIKVVQLKPTDPLFHLLEQIQNEVHRFAITFHKDKRSKGTFRTALTDIPGIGEKTAHDLLLRFGSVKQIQLQTLDDLAAAIGPSKAALVYNHLNG